MRKEAEVGERERKLLSQMRSDKIKIGEKEGREGGRRHDDRRRLFFVLLPLEEEEEEVPVKFRHTCV